MGWTYNSTDLSDQKDQVRLYVGDVDSSDPLLSDEEINFAITQAGNTRLAAAQAADWLSAKFARKADKSVGDMSISASQRSKQYADLADRLRGDNARLSLPYFGGISKTTKETREADPDRVEPAFTVGMLDNPRISSVLSSPENDD